MSGPTKLTLQDLLRAQHVKRWHIVNTSREQTLAEHQYNVTTIALALYNSLVGVDLVINAGEICVLTLAALYHDAPEVRTGDIPTPSKRLIRHFGGAELFDNIENLINPDIPFIGKPHSGVRSLNNFIVMADHIDAAYWIREHAVGARAREVADKCWQNMEDKTNELSAGTDQNWRLAVNDVLVSLLCPTMKSSLS